MITTSGVSGVGGFCVLLGSGLWLASHDGAELSPLIGGSLFYAGWILMVGAFVVGKRK